MKLTIKFKLDFKKFTLVAFRPGTERVNAQSQYILHKKWPLTYISYIHQKMCKLDEGIMLIFVSGNIGHYFWRRVYIYIYIYIVIQKSEMCEKMPKKVGKS